MDTRGVLDNAIFQTILRIALLENSRLKFLKRFLRQYRAVEMRRIRVKCLGYRDRGCCKPGPVKSGCSGHDTIEVPRITLRLHHRLTAASRAANEIGERGVRAIITTNQGLGDFG